jgi:hypothetical protein
MNKASNQIIVFLILTATLAVALFGFSIMSEPGHMMVGCFGTTPGGNCSVLGPIEHFQLHLNAFQSISTGIAKAFVALAGLLLAIAFYLDSKKRLSDNSIQRIVFVNTDLDLVSSRTSIVHWLTLHEKRDPSLSFAVNR